ncbi:MAG: hypothetical protein ACTSQA_04380, partial [Candidatus Heimdallarchaeaceae archaeon]
MNADTMPQICVHLPFQFSYISNLAGDYKLILAGYSQVSLKYRAGRLYHDRAKRNIHASAAPSDDGNDCTYQAGIGRITLLQNIFGHAIVTIYT